MGGGAGRKIVQNALFHGKRDDNKILKVKFLLSRNFVVMAQAPKVFSTIFGRHQFSGPFWGALIEVDRFVSPALGRKTRLAGLRISPRHCCALLDIPVQRERVLAGLGGRGIWGVGGGVALCESPGVSGFEIQGPRW